jgi:hypothetical protein
LLATDPLGQAGARATARSAHELEGVRERTSTLWSRIEPGQGGGRLTGLDGHQVPPDPRPSDSAKAPCAASFAVRRQSHPRDPPQGYAEFQRTMAKKCLRTRLSSVCTLRPHTRYTDALPIFSFRATSVGPKSEALKRFDLGNVDARLTAPVDSRHFRLGDPLSWPSRRKFVSNIRGPCSRWFLWVTLNKAETQRLGGA